MINRYTAYLILPLFSLSLNLYAYTEPTALEQLVLSGKISAQVEATGGHQNKCIQLVIQNNTADSVYGFTEAGRRLNSLNDTEQDILLVRSEVFKLAPNQRDTILLTGFCCQSKKSSPSKGSAFSLGAMAPAIFLIIANLINLHDFPSDAIQNSIWVLSDQHDIRSIPAYGDPKKDLLRQTVADILDIALPWYSFIYESQNQNLFDGTKTHFFAEVGFNIPQRAFITTQVAKPNGEIVYTGESVYFSAGDNFIQVKFPIAGWEIADYDLFLMEDFHTTNKKLRFTLRDE